MAIKFLNTVAVDTDVLYVDASSNNVGIGTASPGAKLDVNGEIAIRGGEGSDDARMYFRASDQSNRFTIETDLDGNTNNDLLGFRSASTDNIIVLKGNGNVGVGTTSPAKKLTIGGIGLGNTDGLKIEDPSNIAYGAHYSYDDASTTVKIGGVVNNALRDCISIARDATRAITIDVNERVGIGTTSPQKKLHVQNYATGESHQAMFKGGAVTVGDYSYVSLNNGYSTEYNKEVRLAAVSEQSNSNKTGFAVLTSPDANGASGHERLRVTADGNVGIGTTSPGNSLSIAGENPATTTLGANFGQFGIFNGSDQYGIQQWITGSGDGHIQVGRIDGSATAYDLILQELGGNVGIGTTSPDSKLTVNGSIESISLNTDHFRARYNSTYYTDYSTNGVRFNGTNQTYSFIQNGTNRMSIDASGNVGIGTTSPNHELVVQGTSNPNIELKNSNYSDGGFVLNRTNYNQQWKWWAQSSQMYFGFSTNESTYSNKMTIQSGGNVGIGTTSPQAKLHVANGTLRTWTPTSGTSAIFESTASNRNFLTLTAANEAELWFGNASTQTLGRIRYEMAGNNMEFWTNGTQKMVINSSGNVGIGTTSPQKKLHVSSSDQSTARIRLSNTNTASGGDDIELVAGVHNVTQDGFSIYNASGGGTQFVIQGGGNVGIGVSSPSAKLQVSGTVKSKGLDVDGQANSSTNFLQYTRTDLTQPASISYDGTGGFDFNLNGGTVKFSDNNGGSVGIGTTSPDSKLHVKEGDITIEGFNTSRYLRFIEPDGSFQGGYVNYDGASNILKIGVHNADDTNTANDTDAISIPRSSGNVGIGTTSPFDKLEVAAANSQLRLRDTDDNNFAQFSYSSGKLVVRNNSTTTTVNQFTLDSIGRMGIGTTSPGEKLEVNGTVKATAATDAYKGYIKNTITCTPLMKTANTDYNYIPYNSTIFGSTPAYYNRMAAAYDGRVKKIILRHVDGVTPTATGMKFKKEVNGTVSTTEYTATVTGGASANFTAIYNFANSDFTFSEGDSIAILAQTSGGTGSIGGVSVQIIVEYNIT